MQHKGLDSSNRPMFWHIIAFRLVNFHIREKQFAGGLWSSPKSSEPLVWKTDMKRRWSQITFGSWDKTPVLLLNSRCLLSLCTTVIVGPQQLFTRARRRPEHLQRGATGLFCATRLPYWVCLCLLWQASPWKHRGVDGKDGKLESSAVKWELLCGRNPAPSPRSSE